MDNKQTNNLKILIKELPEVYQPIFNHNELLMETSRICNDRLDQISNVYKLLEQTLKRPLRVLDMGCAQGFFSLSLAQLGASVKGIDFLDKNIAVCNALANENEKLNVEFEVGRIENIIRNLKDEEYDLVLGLSVFHHIVHEHGLETTKNMLSNLANKVSVAIFEVALAEEPLYWASSQAKNPRDLLSGFAFVHELAKYNTHLSNINRPLFVSSNKFWILNQQIGEFDFYKNESHKLDQGSHQLTRRYFFSKDQIVKLYLLDNQNRIEINTKEYHKEIDFLSSQAKEDFNMPKLILHGANDSELWLVREKIAGELLLNFIDKKQEYNSKKVIEQILKQIVTLEKKELFHNDIRTWNVLIDENNDALLIDYGAISHEINDCVWPYNRFLCFMLFIYEVTEKRLIKYESLRYSSFDLDLLTEPYRSAFIELFKLPNDMLSFSKLQELICYPKVVDTIPSGISILAKAMDEVLSIQNEAINPWKAKANEAEAKANEAISNYHYLVNSRSWKFTKPLRWIKGLLKK